MARPSVDANTASELVSRLYGLTVTKQRELSSYDDVNIHVIVTIQSENQNLQAVSEDGYVLKILNTIDSQKISFVDAMHEAIRCVSSRGIVTSVPVQNCNGQMYSVEKFGDSEHLVQLLNYVPGETLLGKTYTSEICFQAGQLAANIDLALQDVKHPALEGHKRHWSLTLVANLSDKMAVVKDPDDRALIQEVVTAFNEEVVARYDQLTQGVIHADLNEGNILVRGAESRPSSSTSSSTSSGESNYFILGVLDFGDMVREFVVFEAAIAIMYIALESKVIDPIEAGGHVLAGFLSYFRLTQVDIDVLRTCICGRFAQSLVYGAHKHMEDPSNIYCLHTSKRGWFILRQFWSIPKSVLYSKWRASCEQYSISEKSLDLLKRNDVHI